MIKRKYFVSALIQYIDYSVDDQGEIIDEMDVDSDNVLELLVDDSFESPKIPMDILQEFSKVLKEKYPEISFTWMG